MSVERVYDFESAIEAAFAKLLVNVVSSVVTSSMLLDFQGERPRIETVFQAGSENLSYHIVSGEKRNATWKGTINIRLVVSSGDSNHGAYRAKIRNAMAGWRKIVMDCHKLQNVYEQSASRQFAPQEGYETTEFGYSIEFGIDAGAWVELQTN